MSDLLNRIDPDGTLRKAAGDRAGYIRLHLDGPLYLRDYPALIEELHERGLLRLPDEPTLAEIREKAKALTTYRGECSDQAGMLSVSQRWVHRNDVLALLEPREPEPSKTVATKVNRCDNCGVPIMPRAGQWTHSDGRIECPTWNGGARLR